MISEFSLKKINNFKFFYFYNIMKAGMEAADRIPDINIGDESD